MNRRGVLGALAALTQGCYSMSQDDDDGDENEVGARRYVRDRWQMPAWAPAKPVKPTFDPTIRWGDTQLLTVDSSGVVVAQDCLNVTLPLPQTCRLYLHAEVEKRLSANAVVYESILQLVVGNGSTTATIRRQYNGLPQVVRTPLDAESLFVPLDVDWPLPLTNIRGRVSLRGQDVAVRFNLWLVPLVITNRENL